MKKETIKLKQTKSKFVTINNNNKGSKNTTRFEAVYSSL